ncbi:PspA/IM30 family protein [Moraxella oblonga]|uniref:PspA/IM30 family protein n=1 Tax=Moraxella oblonga TaxID=200413 RepID=UPI00082FC60E|nr:PspA/IM30 family protein [Moraxella oblonga]
MSETLSNRVSRLISGSFHALLDKAEDLAPMLAFNEHLRQLDKAIDEVRSELGKVVAQKHLATKKLNNENTRFENLNENILTAVNMGRDDLAQVGIGEQLNIETTLAMLQATIAECNDKEKELEGFIIALQAKRREMLNAIDDFQKTMANNTPSINTSNDLNHIAQKANKTTNAFDRAMSRQMGFSYQTGQNNNAQDLKALEELNKNHHIAQRLAKLKAGQ